MGLLLGILTVVLVLISVFMVLVVLAQRAKSDGGVGAALGGGMAEAAFGAESGNVLTKATQISAVTFFVLAFALYLGHIYQHRHGAEAQSIDLLSSPGLQPMPGDAPSLPEAGAIPPTVETPPTPVPEPVSPPATDPAPAPENQQPVSPVNPAP